MSLAWWLAPAIALLFAGFAFVFVLARCYVRVPSGNVLLVHRMTGTEVAFSPTLVLPFSGGHELVNVGVHPIRLERRGGYGLICKDDIRVDVRATFLVRVIASAEDVLLVASTIGVRRASDPEELVELFRARFVEALQTAIREFEFDDLETRRDDLKNRVIEIIGRNLNGFVLDDVQLDELRQTPIEALDPNNAVDAAGILKLAERNTRLAVKKAELECESKKVCAKYELDMQEHFLEIEQRRHAALANFRAATGQTVTVEQLQKRSSARLRDVVDAAIAEHVARYHS